MKMNIAFIIMLIFQLTTLIFCVSCGDDKGTEPGSGNGLGIPSLNSPSNSGTINDNTPTFDWSDVTDATAYELIVDNSSSFNSSEINQDSLTSSTYTPSSSLPDDTYYWKVRPKDGLNNWGGWSDTWSFSISTDSISIQMVSVSGGTFSMGSNDGNNDEQPVHQVTLTSFSISKYEITNAQYCEFLNATGVPSNGYMGDTLYIFLPASSCKIDYIGGQFVVESGMENYPVIDVSWYGSKVFCEWAGGHLPTESQWEYAARGGQLTHGYTYSGGNNADEVGWYLENSTNPDNPIDSGKGTYPVGQKLANELGLYDMSGNVREWCNDWHGSYSADPQVNPTGPESGTDRVARGGSWSDDASPLRVTYRNVADPSKSYSFIGFRLCRTQ